MNDQTIQKTHIHKRAIEVLGTRALADEWFKSPVIALGGKTPAEAMATKAGAQEVLAVLGRIEYGVYS